jgi:hypothetical protein
MPQPFFRPHVISFAACSLLAGCFSPVPLTPQQIPPSWRIEIERSRPGPVDLTGTYLNAGEATIPSRKTYPVSRSPLSTTLFPTPEKPLPRTEEVQLVQRSQTVLAWVLRRNGETVGSGEFKIEVDPQTGIVALPSETSGGVSGKIPSVAVTHRRLLLKKGEDGFLYIHVAQSAAGLFTIVPAVLTTERWGRWEPSTPEALARVREDESRLRALAVGQPFPDFTATDANGRLMTLEQSLGRATLVHFWSFRNQRDRDTLVDLVKFHAKRAQDEISIISICLDDAGEPEKLSAFLQEKGVTWPQIRDGRDAQGPLAGQFTLRSLPVVFVLDRGGVIRARTSIMTSLDRQIAPLLAASAAK